MSGIAVYDYLLDLVYLEGHRLDQLPLRARKKLLKHALSFSGRLRYTAHRNASGKAYFSEACSKGWEGVIAKRADAPYRHSRSRDWLKFRCGRGQELVIGGFTEWTEAGKLRHPGFLGLRRDKKARDVVRERPER